MVTFPNIWSLIFNVIQIQYFLSWSPHLVLDCFAIDLTAFLYSVFSRIFVFWSLSNLFWSLLVTLISVF